MTFLSLLNKHGCVLKPAGSGEIPCGRAQAASLHLWPPPSFHSWGGCLGPPHVEAQMIFSSFSWLFQKVGEKLGSGLWNC